MTTSTQTGSTQTGNIQKTNSFDQKTDRLDRVLRPKSIAFFGGKEAAEAIRQSKRMGYEGEIWPVHPTKLEMHGYPCFRTIEDLPAPPDAAFLGVNRYLTIDIVKTLSQVGAGGVVCYASGFLEADSETGEGASLQTRLIEAAGDMPLIGPNCYGVINYLDGALLWPDQNGGKAVDKGVAILTQSSNMAMNMTMQKRGLPISYMLAVGNQAQTGLSELTSAIMDDPRVTAIGLHIEGIDNLQAFESMAQKAREKKIPVVVLKMGKSDAAQALTMSHTASLAGKDALADAFFKRLGLARLDTIPAFLESLKLLHIHGPLSGRSICSMSCSGGEASLLADCAEGRNIDFRPLTEPERQRVKATLSDLVTVANPLDYHTFIWGNEQASTKTFTAMMECGFDLSLLVIDFPRLDRCHDREWQAAVKALVTASNQTGQKAAILATVPENCPEEHAQDLIEQGIVPFHGTDEAFDAMEAAAFIAEAWNRPAAAPLHPVTSLAQSKIDGTHLLNENEAKSLLAAYGLPLPSRAIVTSKEETQRQADMIGYPLVLKLVSDEVAHKSDIGGVAVNLKTPSELLDAYDQMAHLGSHFLIETMIDDGVAELIVGINRDPQFGLHLVIGAGGILVDLLKDSQTLLLPTSPQEIRHALSSLKTAQLLTGYRNRPLADIEGAIKAIQAVADYALSTAETLQELDVNPLIVREQGKGAIAVDALIRCQINIEERL
ncbi:MAG: acetate--CoA ligase family protein [Cohaesibacter sp.]|nr:acetate--CoA ligase family protein [Cohaesibacter sp.]